MPTTAGAVVIGVGGMGRSILCGLAARGLKNPVLLNILLLADQRL